MRECLYEGLDLLGAGADGRTYGEDVREDGEEPVSAVVGAGTRGSDGGVKTSIDEVYDTAGDDAVRGGGGGEGEDDNGWRAMPLLQGRGRHSRCRRRVTRSAVDDFVAGSLRTTVAAEVFREENMTEVLCIV